MRKIEASAAFVLNLEKNFKMATYHPHLGPVQFVSIAGLLSSRLQSLSHEMRPSTSVTKASEPEAGSDKQKEPSFSVAS
jgi:hypothetical protein